MTLLRRISLVALIFSIISPQDIRSESNAGTRCLERCRRLHDRSLSRIHFDDDKVQQLFEKQRPLGTLKDVCWRMYDHLDCMKRCPTDREHDRLVRNIRFKCRSVLSEIEDKLICISRYHSFIEVKCSSFVNEAVRIREQQPRDLTPDKETCRYLHLNSLCLENTVNSYCPKAKKIFRRLNFRDYFLNFIVPKDDTLFDDEDLDSCQIFNFVKSAGKTDLDEVEEELTTLRSRLEQDDVTTPTSVTFFLPKSSTTEKTTDKKEFTSLINDLLGSSELTDSSSSFTTPMTSMVTRLPSVGSLAFTRISEKPLERPVETTTTARVLTTKEIIMGKHTNYAIDGKGTIEETTTMNPKQEEMTTSSEFPEETTRFVEELLERIEESGRRALEILGTESPKNISQKEDDAIDDQLSFMDVLEDDDDDDDYEATTSENNVTPSTTKAPEVIVTTEVPKKTTTPRKVFSDDSMEDIPPNFFYSSQRVRPYTVPMPRSWKEEEDVTPVNLDTSTLFGDEFKSSFEAEDTKKVTDSGDQYAYEINENKKIDSNNIENINNHIVEKPKVEDPRLKITTIKMKNLESTSMTPLIRRGQVVKKPILKWNQHDSSKEHAIDVVHRSADRISNDLEDDEYDEDDDDVSEEEDDQEEYWEDDNSVGSTTIRSQENDNSGIDWKGISDLIFNGKKLLIFIYLILFAILLLSLIFGFFFCFSCRRNSSSYDVPKL